MKVAGLDLSLTGTGWCLIGATPVWGRINTVNFRGVDRLLLIEECLTEVLVPAGKIDLLCLEGYSFGSQGRAVFNIGELGGVVRCLLHKQEIPWVEVAPQTLKKFVTGKGNTKKEDMKLHTFKRWGIEFETSDECDAFGLAKMAEVIVSGDTENLTQAQQEAIKKPAEEYCSKYKYDI